MTIPNGADGINTSDGILMVSAYGNSDLSAAELVGNDQDTVTALYKNRYIAGGNSVWSDPGGPLGQVFSVLGAVPGIGFAEAILYSLIGAIVALIGPIPIIGTIVQNLANFLGLTHTTANSAQGSANTANSEIVTLKARLDAGTSGALITDTFDRASASTLGASWTQTYESGSGTLGTDGSGAAHWAAAGGGSRFCTAVYNATTLGTDIQKAQIVLNTEMLNYFVKPEVWLCLRMDSTGDNYVTGMIYEGACEIGYVLSGSYTRIGSAASIDSTPGDLWEFDAGTATSNYEFVLVQNGFTVCTQIDSGPSSLLGASYRHAGLVVRAGAQVVGFASQQRGHPDIAVFTATDYTP